MAVAIMSAMHEENASIISSMQIKSERAIGGRTYYEGKLFDKDVIVVFSHWGKVAASITATTLLTSFVVDEIIFTGVAGAITDKVSIGDIVIGNALYQHDMDASPIIERHHIPLLGRAEITTSPTIQHGLKQATERFLENEFRRTLSGKAQSQFNIRSPAVFIANIASGDQFVSDTTQAADILSRLPEVACVEMEGAAVAQVCEAFGVPFGLVRTISDGANEDSNIDFPAFVGEIAQAYSLGIVKQYLLID